MEYQIQRPSELKKKARVLEKERKYAEKMAKKERKDAEKMAKKERKDAVKMAEKERKDAVKMAKKERKDAVKMAEKERKDGEKMAKKERKDAVKMAEKERKDAEKMVEKERKDAVKMAEKERKDGEKMAKKERKDGEKMAKKERKDAVKMAEKERKDAEKMAEKERKDADKTTEKEIKKRDKLKLKQDKIKRKRVINIQGKANILFTSHRMNQDGFTIKEFTEKYIEINGLINPYTCEEVDEKYDIKAAIRGLMYECSPSSCQHWFKYGIKQKKKVTGPWFFGNKELATVNNRYNWNVSNPEIAKARRQEIGKWIILPLGAEYIWSVEKYGPLPTDEQLEEAKRNRVVGVRKAKITVVL